MTEKCGNCKYVGLTEYEHLPVEKYVCRRYAPRMMSGSGTGWSDQLFPIVSPEVGWCGEYEWNGKYEEGEDIPF